METRNPDGLTLMHAGCQLSYRVEGAAGEPVVFIQGVGVHGEGWRPQIDAFSGAYPCMSFDNRGIGKSLPAGKSLSIEQMAADTVALMDAHGWDTVHLVGHSMGGTIAVAVALLAPERVRSLALLCTAARGAELTAMTWWTLKTNLRARIGTARMRRHAFLEIIMPAALLAGADRDALAESYAPLFGRDLASLPSIAMRQLSALRAYDGSARLGELEGIPTLVVSAAQDRIAPPQSGRSIAEGIPGARYVELPDAAHGVTLHSPDVINSLLREHFQGSGPKA